MADFYSYPTNYSNGSSVNGVSDFFLGYPAAITNSSNMGVIISFIFVALLLLGLPFGVGAALTSASFILTILSLYLWYNGSLDLIFTIGFMTLTIVSTILLSSKKY